MLSYVPKTFFILPTLQTLFSDIFSELHAGEVYGLGGGVSALNGFRQGLGAGGDGEDPAAIR